MREGFDQDDVYIMVEDEFQTTAQTFTQHLHHAEYMRMKKAAKRADPAAIKNVARPTDSRTVMSDELKKKKQSKLLASKQQAGLKATRAGRLDPLSDEDEKLLEEDKDDDPWVGTSLQGLMTSPRKAQHALVGLDRIKSSTRAAAGYSMAETPSPLKGAKPLDLLDVTPVKGKDKAVPVAEEEQDLSDDLDEQRSPLVSKPAQRGVRQAASSSPAKPKDIFKEFATRPSTSTIQKPETPVPSSRAPPKSRMRPLDDFDEIFNSTVQAATATKPPSRDHDRQKPKKTPRDPDAHAKKPRLSDIPLFLG